MGYLQDLLSSFQSVLAFFVAIGVVIFVHELGHYMAARFCRLHVSEFSIGFGPSLFRFVDRHGTIWKFSLIMLGGYVKIPNVGDLYQDRGNDFEPRPVPAPEPSINKKLLTVAGGPVFNFILATVLFAGMITFEGVVKEPIEVQSVRPLPEIFDNELQSGDIVRAINGNSMATLSDFYVYGYEADSASVQIYSIERGGQNLEVAGPFIFPPILEQINLQSPAEKVGLRAGDVVLAVDGTEIQKSSDLNSVIARSGTEPMDFVIWRDGEVMNYQIAAEYQDIPLGSGEFERRPIIGVTLGLAFVPATYVPGPLDSIWIGMVQTGSIIVGSIQSLTKIVTNEISSCNLQGPIGIAQLSGSAASQGLDVFLFLIAVLSAAIGFINLLPIPVLDGGHLLIYGYEKITGNDIGQRVKNFSFMVGFAFIITIFAFTIYNDLTC